MVQVPDWLVFLARSDARGRRDCRYITRLADTRRRRLWVRRIANTRTPNDITETLSCESGKHLATHPSPIAGIVPVLEGAGRLLRCKEGSEP